MAHSEATKQKMRDAKKGYVPWNKGKKMTEEYCRKNSESHIGQTPWHKGKKGVYSAEMIENNRLKHLGKKDSEETKEKKRIAATGNTYSLGKKGNENSFKKGEMTGSNNPNWKGGAYAGSLRANSEGHQWKQAVKKRDGFCCQRCGEFRHKKLSTHHIINFSSNAELRYDVNNGITFCMQCHIDFHKKYNKINNNREQVDEFIARYKPPIWTEYLPDFNFDLN